MKVKGSYTVEAALLMPIILFCLCFILEQTIDMYMQTKEILCITEEWKEFNPVPIFRTLPLIKI
ncbi:MAG: pilus assembly protein [Lachnospiraceae bacterium]